MLRFCNLLATLQTTDNLFILIFVALLNARLFSDMHVITC